MRDKQWSTEHMCLARDAGIRPLRPAGVAGHVDVGATTTTLGARRLLTMLWHKIAVDAGASLEVHTFVRERVLASRASAAERHGTIVERYLEQEARLALALRSLDVLEGETERGGIAIGELVVARAANLPAAKASKLTIEGAARSAHTIACGEHLAAWADAPELSVAAVVYARAFPEPPHLVAAGFERSSS